MSSFLNFGSLLKNISQPHAGSWGVGGVKLPDFGISEFIKPPAPAKNVQGAATQSMPTFSQATPNALAAAGLGAGGGGSYTSGGGSGGGALPATSGQPSSGGGGSSPSPDDAYLNQLRQAFGGQKAALENQIGSYDSDYTNQKSAIDSAITHAQDTLNQENQSDQTLYGQNLKNLLQSDQELRQRRQGTYSALGSLDSSSYLNDVSKADQSLLENQQQLTGERDKNIHNRQAAFDTYQQQANTQLASFANEISRAKEALKGAMANVDMNQANAIASYIQNVQQQAQQVAAQQQAMKLNLAQLASQGVDVSGNLAKMNMGDFSNQFGSKLSSNLQAGMNTYSLPSSNVLGQGSINPYTGKPMTDQEKKQLMGYGLA